MVSALTGSCVALLPRTGDALRTADGRCLESKYCGWRTWRIGGKHPHGPRWLRGFCRHSSRRGSPRRRPLRPRCGSASPCPAFPSFRASAAARPATSRSRSAAPFSAFRTAAPSRNRMGSPAGRLGCSRCCFRRPTRSARNSPPSWWMRKPVRPRRWPWRSRRGYRHRLRRRTTGLASSRALNSPLLHVRLLPRPRRRPPSLLFRPRRLPGSRIRSPRPLHRPRFRSIRLRRPTPTSRPDCRRSRPSPRTPRRATEALPGQRPRLAQAPCRPAAITATATATAATATATATRAATTRTPAAPTQAATATATATPAATTRTQGATTRTPAAPTQAATETATPAATTRTPAATTPVATETATATPAATTRTPAAPTPAATETANAGGNNPNAGGANAGGNGNGNGAGSGAPKGNPKKGQ